MQPSSVGSMKSLQNNKLTLWDSILYPIHYLIQGTLKTHSTETCQAILSRIKKNITTDLLRHVRYKTVFLDTLVHITQLQSKTNHQKFCLVWKVSFLWEDEMLGYDLSDQTEPSIAIANYNKHTSKRKRKKHWVAQKINLFDFAVLSAEATRRGKKRCSSEQSPAILLYLGTLL